MVTRDKRYAPDYAVAPGETLLEVLEEEGMSQAELARRTGLSTKHISQIANGHVPISTDVAIRLERATGVAARLWNNLESRHQERLARIQEDERLELELGLLDQLPIDAMTRLGILTRRAHPRRRLREVYEFFGVANRAALEATWGAIMASFRRSRSHPSDPWAVAVWLRLGELQAADISCRPFDAHRFRATLRDARTLTQERDPSVWHPLLVELCAGSGVAVVIVDEIGGARTHGAARWLAPDRALIQLSIRYRWSDIFWFSFFHEGKHILNQAKRSIVLETKDGTGSQPASEAAADRFAAQFLIPAEAAAELASLRSLDEVAGFAERLGIHPGIVVGRLQHEGLWPRTHGNGLRQRLQFDKA